MRRIPRHVSRFAIALLVGSSLALTLQHNVQAQEGGVACSPCQTLQCRQRQYGQPDLFANYYLYGPCGGTAAQMYVAPQPVPPVVGSTYYTYQPLMPHEMLYKHHRTYYRYYHGGRGLTRTSVLWW